MKPAEVRPRNRVTEWGEGLTSSRFIATQSQRKRMETRWIQGLPGSATARSEKSCFFLLGKSLGYLHGHLGDASEDTPCPGDPDVPYSCWCCLPHQMDPEKS